MDEKSVLRPVCRPQNASVQHFVHSMAIIAQEPVPHLWNLTFFLFRQGQKDFGNPLINNDLSGKFSQLTTKPTSGQNFFLFRREQKEFGKSVIDNDLGGMFSRSAAENRLRQNRLDRIGVTVIN